MKKEYDKIMEHLNVTPEMQQRFLKRVQEEMSSAPPARRPQNVFWKKYASVAACFLILLVGSAALFRFSRQDTPEPPVELGSGIEEVSSLPELSELVGFELTEEFILPFEATETTYSSYWKELAEIRYYSEYQSAIFRKSIGTEDNSGDYNEYADITDITVADHAVTLKGNDGAYSLAVWTEGGYSYSLSLSQAASKTDWLIILQADRSQ